ncbi:iron-siderophore ABC transporter substrate-binding protein [Clostridium sp. D2Q-11]|uniref:Iron-siderophore ABC transporter substrate-binding protein n=1 Tax=Anaeromonas frigoriresistens TaxID=2683708 RepID=A0A942UTN4_9FIRM|nr:iron-siderophore ABC transporter substrate-binding protein [Anaeromonas frigoriresistens]MBS4538938.1 iron-siderophore ABC transporter substrate-binding protein [Anaeromonas frigoriresistens]
MKNNFKVLAILVLIMLVFVGCSNESQDTPEPKEEGSKDIKTIEHQLGTTDIEETPKNIVVLEWVYAEDLLALGIQPSGVADIEGYNNWVNVDVNLDDDVVDVGTRQEPNLETIASLNPDLIITAGFRHEAIYDKLNDIAPTLAFNPYPEEGEYTQYEEMEDTFNKIAEVVEKEEEAKEVLEQLDKKYEEAKKEIEESDLETKDYVLSQAYSSQDVPTIRLFTDNSMAVEIFSRLGLNNSFETDNFELYGFATATVEDLIPVQDANFIYIVQEDDNVFDNQLKDNPVWNKLSFVEEDRTYSLGGDTWVFGGPLSAEVVVDKVLEVLIK